MANAMKRAFYSMQKDVLSKVQSARDRIQRLTEFHRGINSSLTVIEESDRYVMKCDPCGTGGTIRRAGINVGVTKKAYPWSWSKAGVPYYCTHCCIMWEVIPTELHGFPFRNTFPGERTEDPCVIFVYKKPELIPEEYFTRIGKTKTIK